ncbi:hypothetical protein E4U21_003605, partial [Claviceps maximensis]
MSVFNKWPNTSESHGKIRHILRRTRCENIFDIRNTSNRRYGTQTPNNQARRALTTTGCLKSSPKSRTRQELTPASISAPTAARQAALQASHLQRHREFEIIAEKNKADGKDYQKRYNTAARKWVSTMIALPILIVTSYYLFDR